MTGMIGPDYAVIIYNLINAHIHKHCIRCNFINTHTHTLTKQTIGQPIIITVLKCQSHTLLGLLIGRMAWSCAIYKHKHTHIVYTQSLEKGGAWYWDVQGGCTWLYRAWIPSVAFHPTHSFVATKNYNYNNTRIMCGLEKLGVVDRNWLERICLICC